MKTLILDYSKWRCGGNGMNQLGNGPTLLLNDEGFMCCLGQFAKQINPTITNKLLLGVGVPEDLEEEIEDLVYIGDKYHGDTNLTNSAISINDDSNITPEERIELLKEKFAEYNYEIEVINKP